MAPAKPTPKPWSCMTCQATHADGDLMACPQCHASRDANWDCMISRHVLEHLEDGLITPLEIQQAMIARPIRSYKQLNLQYIVSRLRMLTRDTTKLARDLAKAQASSAMLDVLAYGDTKDKIAVLKGIQVLGEVHEHTGSLHTVTEVRHVHIRDGNSSVTA